MSTDGVNIAEDAEMAECDGDKVVTMMDVLQEQQDFEEDVNAVLGASDDKNCTYSKGYIKRQALYACLTCCTEAKIDPTKRAGVCLACSLTCHENHELIELYTKRNFRCDCGNPKFNSHPCQFTPDKNDLNDENIYNQNFSGLYCTCKRPYPDPESTIEDDMIQCIICEDWLHATHLEAVVPANDQYSEMVCKGCMDNNEFLHDYSLYAVNVETGDVDITTINGDNSSLCNGILEEDKMVNGKAEDESDNGNITLANGDVEMEDEGKKKNEVDVGSTTNIQGDKVDDSLDTKTSEDTNQNDTSAGKSIESMAEENTKPDNLHGNDMDKDTQNKKPNQEEEFLGTTETNEEGKCKHASSISDIDEVNTKPNKDTEETQSENNETTTDDQQVGIVKPTDSTCEKMDSIEHKSEKTSEASKEEIEAQEQNMEQTSKEEKVESDNIAENITDSNERTEQQLIDDLSALTADNPMGEENCTSVEEKPVECVEQTEDTKINEDEVEESNELTEKTTNNGDGSANDKPVSEAGTGNIEVPDTSQSEKIEKEKLDDKTDSVMNAIDELLETANKANESEVTENSKQSISEGTEVNKEDSKESTESKKDTSGNNDAESETAKETTDINDKTTTDVEMSDTTIAIVAEESRNKVVGEPTVESVSKEDNDSGAIVDTSEALAADAKVESESPKDTDNQSEPAVTVNEIISQDEASTDEAGKALKTSDDDDSTKQNDYSTHNEIVCDVTENTDHKRKLSTDLTEDISSKKAKLECRRPREVKRVFKGATFWPSNFRQKLCTCGECLAMYKDLKVLFLTDLEDTVSAYESLGKENLAGGASQYEKGMQALSSLDRIQQINALTEYNNMRDKLLDFLKSFKDRKEIVKEEDIKAFFAGMKPRREPDGVYFCR